MKIIVTIGLILLHFSAFAQNDHMKESRYNPFSILFITPDSAFTDNSLRALADTVEAQYRDSYYSYIKGIEMSRKFEPEDKRHEIEMKVQRAKWAEMEIYDFKYYHVISMLSCPELLGLFNEYPWEKPCLTCDLIERRNLYTYDLSKLVAHYGFDYIVTFKNVKAEKGQTTPTLKFITTVYSRKEKRVINEIEISGHVGHYTNKYGELMRCSNDLQCLLETAVKSSTEKIFDTISSRETK